MPSMSHEQRMAQHQHNSHRGRFHMALTNLRGIYDSPTVTPEVRAAAFAAIVAMEPILAGLDRRVNADGTITEVRWSPTIRDPNLIVGDP